MTRYTTFGNDNTCRHSVTPMSEARRQHVYGPLVPMRPDGEPPLWIGTGLVLLVFAAGTFAIVAFGG